MLELIRNDLFMVSRGTSGIYGIGAKILNEV
jgi:hypothetical protein